jgi:hypothetical protein
MTMSSDTHNIIQCIIDMSNSIACDMDVNRVVFMTIEFERGQV